MPTITGYGIGGPSGWVRENSGTVSPMHQVLGVSRQDADAGGKKPIFVLAADNGGRVMNAQRPPTETRGERVGRRVATENVRCVNRHSQDDEAENC